MNVNIISIPIQSMYGIFTYICLIFMVNVGKYTIHESYGILTCFGHTSPQNQTPESPSRPLKKIGFTKDYSLSREFESSKIGDYYFIFY